MKSIDIKSLLIGTLLTSTIFLGVAATPPEVKRAMDATTGKFWGIAKDHELKALAKSRAKDLGYVGIKNAVRVE